MIFFCGIWTVNLAVSINWYDVENAQRGIGGLFMNSSGHNESFIVDLYKQSFVHNDALTESNYLSERNVSITLIIFSQGACWSDRILSHWETSG